MIHRTVPAFVILSEARARTYEPAGNDVCISITNPKADLPELSSRFRAILRVSFTDISAPSPYEWDKLFSEEDASQILAFVTEWADAERIVIHCRAGLGRSPGVALGLSDLNGSDPGELEERYPLWNTWVRSELVRIGRRGPDDS